jgi:hypothetical protein
MEKLLEEVKNYLDITWEMSSGESNKLSGIINRGKAYIEGKIGECDFTKDTQEKDLLMNYCMYARSGQTDEFMRNYKSEIIALQMRNWRKKKEGDSDAQTKG